MQVEEFKGLILRAHSNLHNLERRVEVCEDLTKRLVYQYSAMSLSSPSGTLSLDLSFSHITRQVVFTLL